ncbi:MAG: hypothetical protein HQM14_05000 [SAR324 cluster bacterium]|nr:hypothetical protein [SAR324 cluster bacterium]
MSASKKEPVVPLILQQNKNKVSGKKPCPYQFGADIYEQYANRQNPFIDRVLSAQQTPSQLAPEKVQALFQYLQGQGQYQLGLPTKRSPHHKRKVVDQKEPAEKKPMFSNVETLKEDSTKLKSAIDTFFQHVLGRLRYDADELSIIINELIPLFLEYQIQIKVYDAFRIFYSTEQFLETLTKISQDNELENFEFFCSALFGFYSQLQ